MADRIGIPLRFLIADRRQRAPVEAIALGGVLEVALILRQTLLDIGDEADHAEILVIFDDAEMAVAQSRQIVCRERRQIVLDLVVQAGVAAGWQRPGDVLVARNVEGDLELPRVAAVQSHQVGVGDRVGQFAIGDAGQQIVAAGIRDVLPQQRRVAAGAQFDQPLGHRTALWYCQLAVEIVEVARFGLVGTVDQLLANRLHRLGETHLFAARRRDIDARRTDIDSAAGHVVEYLRGVGQVDQLQLHPQFFSEAAQQVALVTGRSGWSGKAGGRAVGRRHPQHTAGERPLEPVRIRRAGDQSDQRNRSEERAAQRRHLARRGRHREAAPVVMSVSRACSHSQHRRAAVAVLFLCSHPARVSCPVALRPRVPQLLSVARPAGGRAKKSCAGTTGLIE